MKKLFVIIALGFVINPQAFAQPPVKLVEYRFEVTPAGTGTSSWFYKNNAALTTASNVAFGPGLTGLQGFTQGASGGAVDKAQWADHWSVAFDGTDYYGFTLTPPAGQILVVEQVKFKRRISGTGPQSHQIRSSVNNFSSSLWAPASSSSTSWISYIANLAGVSALGPITLRIYGFTSTGTPPNDQNGTFRIDTLQVYGHLDGVFNLPVEFLSFTGRARDSEIDLRWSTATEHDNDHFSIEKSYDLASWEEIGQVIGAGNSEMTSDYTLVDRFPRPGLNYYRLSQTDIDGTTVELKTIVVIFGNANTRTRVMDVSGRIIDDWNTQHIFGSGLYLVEDEYGNVRKLYIPP